MAYFPYPDNNMTSFVDFMQYANSFVHGLLGAGILIIVGAISFIAGKNYSTDKSLGFSSFLVMICAVLLRFMNLIGDKLLWGTIVIFIGSMIWLTKERSVENFGV